MGIQSWLINKVKGIVKLNGNGEFRLEVVGESHYQKNLKRVCGGYAKDHQEVDAIAILVHEDSNPHDNKAIRIDIAKKPVGYLRTNDARRFRKLMKEAGHAGRPATCNAKVVGGWKRSRTDIGSFGVRLDLELS